MNVIKRLTDRYRYSWVVLKSLVKTDFKLRYQGSFLGVAWSVLKPLMLFCVMYLVFARFLHMTDGTSIYPVVLLLGISSWQFVNEAITVGLRSVVDRGDLLRKIHFPNYIVVVSATVGSLISLGINFVVVIIFAIMNRAHFTWRVLFLPINVAELYLLTLGITLILATMYVYFRDVAHIWDVLQQVLFYATPIIYPLMTVQQLKGKVLGLDGETIAKLMLMNPIAQTIQDIRHNLIAPDSTPTVWNLIGNPFLRLVPLVLSLALFVLGVYVFRKFNRKFAEVM
ncbi:ABC transporter permease [Bifidobacterium favimelis]|uniref:Transport permease protein n=1 Tax=Bifidobacterium favimelis TaxID=3122979 RepID=A0ABU8ZPD2_9BIFI